MSTLEDKLNEIMKRADAATPGPWELRPDEHDDWGVIRSASCGYHRACKADGDIEPDLDAHRKAGTDPTYHNADFIADARTTIPRLVRALRVCIGQRNEWGPNPDLRADMIEEKNAELLSVLEGDDE